MGNKITREKRLGYERGKENMIEQKFMKSNKFLYKIGNKNPETLAAVHTHTHG